MEHALKLTSLEDLAQSLKRARVARGLSQRDLSRLTGLPQSHISKIEHGQADLRMSSLVALARALQLEPVLVPRALLPTVEAILTRPHATHSRPAYALPLHDDDDDGEGEDDPDE